MTNKYQFKVFYNQDRIERVESKGMKIPLELEESVKVIALKTIREIKGNQGDNEFSGELEIELEQ